MDNFVDISNLGNNIFGISNTSFGGIDASEIITVEISETETEDIKYYPMCTFESIVGECIDDSPLIYQKYDYDKFEVSPDSEGLIEIGRNPRTRLPLYEFVYYYHCARYNEIRNSEKQEVTISLNRRNPESSAVPAETYKFNGERTQLSKLRMRGSDPNDVIDNYVRTMYTSQNNLVRLRDVIIIDREFTITFCFKKWNVPNNTHLEDIFDEILNTDGNTLRCTYMSYTTDMQMFRFVLDRGNIFTFNLKSTCQDIPNKYNRFTYTINDSEEKEFLFDIMYGDEDFGYVTEDSTINIIAEVNERKKINISSQGDLEATDASTGELVLNFYDIIATYHTSYDHLDSATFNVRLTDTENYEGIIYKRTYFDESNISTNYSDEDEIYVNGDSCTILMEMPNINPVVPRPISVTNWVYANLFLRAKEKYIPIKLQFVITSNIDVYIGSSVDDMVQVHVQDMNYYPSKKIDFKYPETGYYIIENEGGSVVIKCSWRNIADDPTIIKQWTYVLSSGKHHFETANNNEKLTVTPTRDLTIYINTIKTNVVNIRIDRLPDTLKIFENYFNEYIEYNSYTTMPDEYYCNKTSVTITETGNNDIISYSMQRMAYADDSSVGSPDSSIIESREVTYINNNLYIVPEFYYKLTVRSMRKYIPKSVNIYFLDNSDFTVSNISVIVNNPPESDTTMNFVETENMASVQDLGLYYSLWKYTMTSGFDFNFKIHANQYVSERTSSIEYFMRGYTNNWYENVQTDVVAVPNNDDGNFIIVMENGTFENFYDYDTIDIFIRPSSIRLYQYTVSTEDNHVNVAVWRDNWDEPNDVSLVITENIGPSSVVLHTTYKHNNQYKLKLWCSNELYLNYTYIISDVNGSYSRIIDTSYGKFPENSEPVEYVSPEGFFEQYGDGTMIQFGALPETVLYMRVACEEEPKKWLMIPPRGQGSRDIFIRL